MTIKSSDFDIEKTHLQEVDCIEKLTPIVMIAFVWCYKTGIFLHVQMKKIEIKKHRRKTKCIFKYRLSFIANILLNSKSQSNNTFLFFVMYLNDL